MNARFIKLTLLIVLGNICSALNAQSFQAKYAYDANGNRILANIIYLSTNAPNNAPVKVEESLKIGESQELKVNIYPNPTKGDLRVDIEGGTGNLFDNPNNAIKVWDMQGKLVVAITSIGASNRVDLNQFAKGAYIMHIILKGETKTYKILKD